MVRDQAPVKGIGGIPVPVEGKMKVALTLGEAPLSRTHYVVFLVVKLPLNYNAILGRPVLYDFEVVTSIRYLTMKFPTETRVGVVRGRQEEARVGYMATVAEPSSADERFNLEVMKVRDEKKEVRKEPVGKLKTFPLSEAEVDKVFSLNTSLTEEHKIEAMALIRGMPQRLLPLPDVNKMVDSTAGFDYMSTLDAMSGYHQILIDKSNEEKTSFITEDETYCYKAIFFGLKNAGATYQRLMNKIFKIQIGRNVEVYMDDMVVKSLTFQQYLVDLKEVFEVLEQYKMRLNPAKCAFFIRDGKFLGYMVSGKGIKPNPEKVEAILKMPEPTCVRDVQRLIRRVVALNRFMLKSAERCLSFFKKLRKVPNFEWNEDCQQAFKELNAILVREGGEQKPVFYVSKVLKDAEIRYLNIEKLAYALLLAVRKFKVYLEGHQAVVMTDQPLKKILHRLETSGRMLAWCIEIGPYCLEYRPRTTIKAQALIDFIAECSFNEEQAGLKPLEAMKKKGEGQSLQEFSWSASNNVAKYEALINGTMIAMEVRVTDLAINSDSQLVINQITGAYQARDPIMQKYLAKVKTIEAELSEQGIPVQY
ncbi:uncharacterized protein LOC110611653 [Manihot esculenta]|uniref:uncharacterized protein LOC110611653 n=1 Tax=Manihot esculenta TaxID=3983 RepID=UPI000B5D4D84|nr:uncharacterized protein LOC110611653 [Manihot esculenta]